MPDTPSMSPKTTTRTAATLQPGGESSWRRPTVNAMPVDTRAHELLRDLAGPGAEFREHQLEAIRDLVDERARVLCVQRTGWGKSAVYFIAAALLREEGAGPALI